MRGRLGKLAPIAGAVACGASALLSLAWALFNATVPWPLEYREGATVLATARWVEGFNPYALEQQPAFLAIYGFVYHLVAYPFAKLLGATFLTHRILSISLVIAAAAGLVAILRMEKVGWALALTGGFALLTSHGRDLMITARPDALGFLLFLASLAVPWLAGFSRRSLAASAALGILAFFTKAYFLLGLAIVGLYLLLFRSWRKGLAFGVASLVALSLACVLVDRLLPAYFTDVFFVQLSYATSVWAHLRRMFVGFSIESAGLFAMGALLLVRRVLTRGERPGGPGLGRWDPGLPAFALLIDLAALVLKLGLHVGNGLLYYHQLLTPLLIWSILRDADGKGAWTAAIGGLAGLSAVGWMSLGLPLPPDFSPAWKGLEAIVESAPRIVVPPPLAYLAYARGKPVYDNGHTEYCPGGIEKNFLPVAAEFDRRCVAHQKALSDGISNREFDVVMVVPGQSPMIDRGLLRSRYALRGRVLMPMVFADFEAEIWTPPQNLGPGP